MSRQVSYSLAVKGNNIAKGSVMLILANLNATTIHFLLSSRNIMAVCFGLKMYQRERWIILLCFNSVTIGAKNRLAKTFRDNTKLCLLIIRYFYAKCKLDLTILGLIDWLLLFTSGKIKNWYCLFLTS